MRWANRSISNREVRRIVRFLFGWVRIVRALADVKTTGMTYFNGPFSGGFDCVIPRGSVMRVYDVTELGFLCTPEGELESALVPVGERSNPKYSSAAFTFNLGEIGRRFELVSLPGK